MADLGFRAISFQCDVNVEADISSTIAATEEAFGGLNIIVNDAGIATLNAPEHMTDPIKNDMPDLYEGIVARTPAGRFGTPEECAGTAIFLASEASNFVTGQAIAVCGGYSVC